MKEQQSLGVVQEHDEMDSTTCQFASDSTKEYCCVDFHGKAFAFLDHQRPNRSMAKSYPTSLYLHAKTELDPDIFTYPYPLRAVLSDTQIDAATFRVGHRIPTDQAWPFFRMQTSVFSRLLMNSKLGNIKTHTIFHSHRFSTSNGTARSSESF